jgi:hypothetical protein
VFGSCLPVWAFRLFQYLLYWGRYLEHQIPTACSTTVGFSPWPMLGLISLLPFLLFILPRISVLYSLVFGGLRLAGSPSPSRFFAYFRHAVYAFLCLFAAPKRCMDLVSFRSPSVYRRAAHHFYLSFFTCVHPPSGVYTFSRGHPRRAVCLPSSWLAAQGASAAPPIGARPPSIIIYP